jgi:hypothetical protein
MKSDYSVIRFTKHIEENRALLENRDYHTFCVIQDALGSVSPETISRLVMRGEAFPINPAWPCCQGEEWYRNAGHDISYPESVIV